MKKQVLTLFPLILGISTSTYALHFQMEPGSDLVGEMQTTYATQDDDFVTLSRRYQVGYHELEESNPDVDPLEPGEGTLIVLPTRFILPPGNRKGIFINLAELRLYYFPNNGKEVYTYPIGIGKSGAPTPVGHATILSKHANPSWHVPKSIWDEQAAKGNILPHVVPPGPENPLGDFAIRTSFNSYLIHGTNAPAGVGLRSSHGCIRLYPESIQELFPMVSIGTPIEINNVSFKIGMANQQLYLETSSPVHEFKDTIPFEKYLLKTRIEYLSKTTHIPVNWGAVEQISNVYRNIPYNISASEASNPHHFPYPKSHEKN